MKFFKKRQPKRPAAHVCLVFRQDEQARVNALVATITTLVRTLTSLAATQRCSVEDLVPAISYTLSWTLHYFVGRVTRSFDKLNKIGYCPPPAWLTGGLRRK